MKRTALIISGTMVTTGISATIGGPTVARATVVQPSYHVLADTTEAETLRILDDPKVAADIQRGLAEMDAGQLYSFEDVFGEPQ